MYPVGKHCLKLLYGQWWACIPDNITGSALFYSTGEMSLVIRAFGQVLGDLRPVPFPAVRAHVLPPAVLFVLRLSWDWMGTFSVLPAGGVSSCWQKCHILEARVEDPILRAFKWDQIPISFSFFFYCLIKFCCPPFKPPSLYPKSASPVFLFIDTHPPCIV